MRKEQDIKSMLPPELAEFFAAVGEKPFRAEQVFRWLHGGAASFSEMTNLPAALREKLDATFRIDAPALEKKQISAIDGTAKYLWRFRDGNAIESVVMDYEHGKTVCISTQAGCRMGCVFCASTLGGLQRDLTASEMEDQVFYSQLDAGSRISNVVLMGIGEPLDNFDNVVRFLELVTHGSGLNISARRVSLSTCGIIENIDKLSRLDIKLTLSVSLHAPDDETRSRLMPVNRETGVDRLLESCRRYFSMTGRRVTLEYAMINGVNDTTDHARLLAEKLKAFNFHLNLIPLSDVPERHAIASSKADIKAFAGVLDKHGVNYTVRRQLGVDIEASCGQLRRKSETPAG